MKPEISVIVPVYNVEPYLKRCLNSIIEQSLKKIEIILIDDGSTDRSGLICDEYAKIDSRITVIHQKNGGLSSARNIGIKLAKGDYIMFVDSDDYVMIDYCKLPFEIAKEKNADIVLFPFFYVGKNKNKLDDEEDGFKSKQEAFDIILKKAGVNAWSKLYRRCLFDDVKFPEGFYYEDNATTYKLILNADRIYYTNNRLYYYCFREGSITSSKKRIIDFIVMFSVMYNDLKKFGYHCFIHKGILVTALRYLTYFGHDEKYSDICKKMIDDFSDYKSINKQTYILLFLYKHNKSLFDYICIIFGKRKHPERF